MTQAIAQDWKTRDAWVSRVRALVDQVENWSLSQGWEVDREDLTIEEDSLGSYVVPSLQIQRPDGQLLLNPIALKTIGSGGRVDLRAIPTLSRVKLIETSGDWRIMTDSGVPIRLPWTIETFMQLADDLLN